MKIKSCLRTEDRFDQRFHHYLSTLVLFSDMKRLKKKIVYFNQTFKYIFPGDYTDLFSHFAFSIFHICIGNRNN